MGLETAALISDLNASNPVPGDPRSQGDDHIRLLKTVLKNTFPNADRAQYFRRSITKTADYVVLSTDMEKVFVTDCSGGDVDLTLPTLVAANDGWTIMVVRADASVNDVNVLGTINGETNFTIAEQYQAVSFTWTGTTWRAIHYLRFIAGVPTFRDLDVLGFLDLTGTSAAKMNVGTTAQRPGSPDIGLFRTNSDTKLFEFGDGTTWRQPSLAYPIAGGCNNLLIQSNSGTPNTQIDISAAAVTVETSSGIAYRIRNFSTTINAAATGADGIDQGGLANDTWYASLVIYNPTTDDAAGLLVKASDFSATMILPSGYTAWARYGWHRTDASAHLKRITQKGNWAQYLVTSGATALPNIDNGTKGTWSLTAPIYLAVSVVSFVPTTAISIAVVVNPKWNNGGYANIYLAPNVNYSGVASINPPLFTNTNGVVGTVGGTTVEMLLEGTTIAWASDNSGGAISCLGWKDNF